MEGRNSMEGLEKKYNCTHTDAKTKQPYALHQ